MSQYQTPPKNENYGSIADPSPHRGPHHNTLFEEAASVGADLGDIKEDEQLLAPLTTGDEDDEDDNESECGSDGEDYDYDEEEHISSIGRFRLGASTTMSARNIMVHERRTSSFMNHGAEYELVPTQLKNNVRMVEDVNLIGDAKGRLYLARYSFFNNCHDLKFALTVQPDIYERIMSELNDAFTVPCGLFFCCHGGDGAHTGVSHNDYVDIKLAWLFFLIVLGFLLAVDFLVD